MIRSLSYISLRNLAEGSFDFSEGITVVCGKNGSGKTTLLEAIHLLCEGFSFRTRNLAELVAWNRPEMILRGAFSDAADLNDSNERAVSVSLSRGVMAKENGIPCKGIAAFFGKIPAVIMQPADVEMARGAPELRRRYLDELLCFRNARNADLLRRYRRVLAERNQWLRQNRSGDAVGGEALFSVLTSQWIDLAASVWRERIALVREISPIICSYYELLAGKSDEIAVAYKSSVANADGNAESFRSAFVEKLDTLDFAERMQGISLAGPHRDDILLSLHGHEMRSSGSQGQCRSATIALRLAASDLASSHLAKPVMLLDDIFAELDKNRRGAVADVIREKKCQVFVSTPRAEDLPFDADAKIGME